VFTPPTGLQMARLHYCRQGFTPPTGLQTACLHYCRQGFTPPAYPPTPLRRGKAVVPSGLELPLWRGLKSPDELLSPLQGSACRRFASSIWNKMMVSHYQFINSQNFSNPLNRPYLCVFLIKIFFPFR